LAFVLEHSAVCPPPPALPISPPRRTLAVGMNNEPVGPQPRRDIAFGVLDLVAVDRQHRNLVVAVAGDQRRLAVRRNGDVARTRFVVAQIDLAYRRERIAGDGKDRDRSLRAVGHQREGPGAIDRRPRRPPAPPATAPRPWAARP